MFDKIGDFFTLLVIGAVAVHIVTNPNSKGTIGTVFSGVAEDISASVGG
jgi:hypothetical protein